MTYYLGVDIGTSSAKAVAFSREGKMMERSAVTYGMRHPQPDRSEQDPEEIYRAVCKVMEELLAKLKPAGPLFVSFSAAMHSIIAVDQQGKPMTPCVIWADNRAAAIAGELRSSTNGRLFYERTGVPIHSMSPFCKLLWWRKYAGDVFSGAARFIGIKEYIYWKLSGVYCIDSPTASATGLLNLAGLHWDEGILDYLGLAMSKLSAVKPPTFQVPYQIPYEPGFLSNESSAYESQGLSSDEEQLSTDGERLSSNGERLFFDGMRPIQGLPAGTPLVIGGSDGALANLSTGAVGDGIMAVTIGTSGAARIASERKQTDPEMRTFCYHALDKLYISGGATNNGAVVLQWLKESLLQTSDSYDELYAMAGKVAAGAEGLLCIPYILGERAPIWDSEARGIFFGLDIRHQKAHLVRAAMEGVIYCLYSIGRILSDGRAVREIHASGGFSRSREWLQILADVFNLRVLSFGEEESSAKGAVVVGIEALQLERLADFKSGVQAVYEPDQKNYEVYARRFERFQRLYKLVKEEFRSA